MGLFIGCVGSIALLMGLSLKIVIGPLGAVLAIGALVSALLVVIVDVRYGAGLQRSLLGVLIVGVLSFGLIFGVMWYFMSLASSSKPIIEFK